MCKRAIEVDAANSFNLGQQVMPKVFQGWPRLLDAAQQMLDIKQWGVAVILAQTACEVIAERVMGTAYPVDHCAKYVPSYSLIGNDRLREYKQLTGDNIDSDAAFWHDVQSLAKLRHECVHRGVAPDQQSAVRAAAIAKKFVEHVAKHNGL